jgi:hypothetical protein
MRNKLKKSITVLMAILVLLSSTGFGFIEHQCLVRGKSMKFISQEKADSSGINSGASCCAKKKAQLNLKGTFISKTDCCKESPKFERVGTASTHGSPLIKFAKSGSGDVLSLLHALIFVVHEWISPDSSASYTTLSFTSLFHGRSLCVFVQSFLI